MALLALSLLLLLLLSSVERKLKLDSVVASQPLLLVSFDKLIKKSKQIAFHFHLICFALIVTVGFSPLKSLNL